MLIYSMTASIDGYIEDRDGRIDWTEPSDELFAFHLERVRTLGAHLCGRKLYETMLPWETDPSMRETELGAEFADVWTALPKIVFSRTSTTVAGNARLATGTLTEEIAAARAVTDLDLEIGGARLAGQAIELDLVDELRIFRAPSILGAGMPLLPAVAEIRQLQLIESRSFAPGVVYERFARR